MPAKTKTHNKIRVLLGAALIKRVRRCVVCLSLSPEQLVVAVLESQYAKQTGFKEGSVEPVGAERVRCLLKEGGACTWSEQIRTGQASPSEVVLRGIKRERAGRR